MAKKLSIRPTSKEQEMAEFISQANANPHEETKSGGSDPENKPWNDPRVRDDVMVMVSLRLPEPYALKLRYLSKMTKVAQQELLRDLVIPWIDRECEKY